ncbi:MAG: (2Fe-2S) ferredoxin domain-containing protein [Deltaproteobacteria bacterium]
MKTPTRSPTHADVDMSRLSAMGLEVEDIASDGVVTIPALVELAEDRGRPVSHYLAAIPLGDEVRVAGEGPVLKICAGSCQQWGALDLLDHAVERWQRRASFKLVPVACLDRCDQAPACELTGDHGQLVLAPASKAAIDEALDQLA